MLFILMSVLYTHTLLTYVSANGVSSGAGTCCRKCGLCSYCKFDNCVVTSTNGGQCGGDKTEWGFCGDLGASCKGGDTWSANHECMSDVCEDGRCVAATAANKLSNDDIINLKTCSGHCLKERGSSEKVGLDTCSDNDEVKFKVVSFSESGDTYRVRLRSEHGKNKYLCYKNSWDYLKTQTSGNCADKNRDFYLIYDSNNDDFDLKHKESGEWLNADCSSPDTDKVKMGNSRSDTGSAVKLTYRYNDSMAPVSDFMDNMDYILMVALCVGVVVNVMLIALIVRRKTKKTLYHVVQEDDESDVNDEYK